jgi:hypothetical protein
MEDLILTIAKNEFPAKHEEYGGGGVIVTSDKERKGHASDFILFHPSGDSLAWLMFQIKARLGSQIDSMTIAKCIKTQIDLGLSVRDSMLITAVKMNDLMLFNHAGTK